MQTKTIVEEVKTKKHSDKEQNGKIIHISRTTIYMNNGDVINDFSEGQIW